MRKTSQCINWKLVRSEIRRTGQSQAAIAEICGVSRETFNRMVNGAYDAELSFSFVDSLAGVLGMNVYQLFEVRPHSYIYYQATIDEQKAITRDGVFASIGKYVDAML